MPAVPFAPLHRPPDEGTQPLTYVKLSSPSCNHSVTVGHTVSSVGNTTGTDEKGSLEYPSLKDEAHVDNANSEDEVLHKNNCDRFQDFMELSSLSQKPTYRVLLPVGVNTGTQRTVGSLMDTCTSPELINSSFPHRTGRQSSNC